MSIMNIKGSFMKNTFRLLGIIAVAVILVFSFTACEGPMGPEGKPGEDGTHGNHGTSTTITISDDGYWVIDGVKTGFKAIGEDGSHGTSTTITISDDGYWIIDGEKTGFKAIGEDGSHGTTPTITISNDGYWVVDGIKTGHKAIGEDGKNGTTPIITISDDGYWVIDGTKTEHKAIGEDGSHAPTITISDDGYWIIGGVKTGYKAVGEDGLHGSHGDTPHIGINGNWWIGTTDTGVIAGVHESNRPYLVITTSKNVYWPGEQIVAPVIHGIKQSGFTIPVADTSNILVLDGQIISIADEPGEYVITVIHWSGVTADYPITVFDPDPTLVITGTAATGYSQYEAFNSTGLEVRFAHGDILSEPMTHYSLSWNDQLLTDGNTFITAALGEKTITVNMEGRTGSFTITIYDSDTIVVTNTDQWNAALATIQSSGSNRSHAIRVSGNVAVPGITATITTTTGFGSNNTNVTVVLFGSGKLYLNSQGSIIRIANGQTLIIDSEDLILEGLKRGQNEAGQDNINAVVYIQSGGMLELRKGIISGNKSYSSGGVYVYDSGTFTMTGGEISGNTADNGGGVYVSGTFTMEGGKISGNTADYYGGGVYVSSGRTFSKTGSSIIYGNNEGDNSNTGGNSHAVHCVSVYGPRWRNTTLGAGVDISTDDLSSPPWNR
jgi:predicted CopG family antitoxin